MEEPVKVAEAIPEDQFNSSTRTPLPKIQVKSQNPISKKPIVLEASHGPLPSGKNSDQKSLSPKPIERLQGGGTPVKSHRNTKSLKSPKSPLQAQTPKSAKMPMSSPKTSSFVGPNVTTPTSPKDIVDKDINMETSPTYPYNLWGPITKYGYLDNVPPTWAQRHHFQGKPVSVIFVENFSLKILSRFLYAY